MSLCDRCYNPGACCSGFVVNWLFPLDWTVEQVTKHVQEYPTNPLPFVAIEPFSDKEKEYETPNGDIYWRFSCPKLGPDGRCTIYRNRPEPCRNFEPASEKLCVHFKGSEGDERSVL